MGKILNKFHQLHSAAECDMNEFWKLITMCYALRKTKRINKCFMFLRQIKLIQNTIPQISSVIKYNRQFGTNRYDTHLKTAASNSIAIN